MNTISQKLSQKRGEGDSCVVLERTVRDNFSEKMTLSKEVKVRGLGMSVSGQEQPWKRAQPVRRS